MKKKKKPITTPWRAKDYTLDQVIEIMRPLSEDMKQLQYHLDQAKYYAQKIQNDNFVELLG